MSFCHWSLSMVVCLGLMLLLPSGAASQHLSPQDPGVDPRSRDANPWGEAIEAARWVPSFRSMGQNALDIARAPVSLSEVDPHLILGVTGGLVGAMAVLDAPVYRQMSTPESSVAEATGVLAAPGRWYDRLGPDQVSLGVAGALAISGGVLQRPRLTRTAVHVAEAVVYTKVVTGVAKGVIGRTRPFAAPNPFAVNDFDAVATTHRNLAMPSGHTSRAFALASVLSHEFDRWYVSVPAYGFATSVGLERVHSGDHWLTDVVVGAGLGYAIGRMVADPPPSKRKITYRPIVSPGHVGVSVRF